MNLQKKLDLIEQYRTCTSFLSHPDRGIDCQVPLVFEKDTTAVNIEVSHETQKITARER